MKIGLILGTRPEIIKLAPVIQELCARQQDHCVIHTNQHYDPELDGRFFDELELEPPGIELNIGSGAHGLQTGRMLEAVEQAIVDCGITHVIVQGDTNSGLAGALAAAKLSRSVAHVEAGLRSYDARMPEEINRRLIDHVSHELFPPTATARDVLHGESVAGLVHEPVGNTVVDAVLRYAPRLAVPLDERDGRILLTLHRPENVDCEETLRAILGAVGEVACDHGLGVSFPAHPRTRERLEQFGIALPRPIEIEPPQTFSGILEQEATARLVITDSGGLQEEACVLRTPCVVVRSHTDRPEAVAAGSAILAGTDRSGIVAAASAILSVRRTDWPQPFGDGTAGQQIVDRLTSAEPVAMAGA